MWGPSLAVVVSHDIEYVEPDALIVPLRITPSNWNCTLATPWLAVAFAATSTVRVMVELFAGAVIEMTGAVPCARVNPNSVK